MTRPRPTITKKFLSRAEFAQALGVSEPTVDRMIEAGRIAATQVADEKSRWLIPLTELDRLEAEANSNLRLPGGGQIVPGSVPVRLPDEDAPEVLPGGGRIAPESIPVRFSSEA